MNLTKLFILQFTMFAEMAAGYYVCSRKILKPSDRAVLSKLVVNLLLPASILNAFNMEFTSDVLSCFLQIFLVSLAVQAFCSFLAAVLYNRKNPDMKPILQYATVCSNAGFLGNAVAEGVYGSEGLLFAQIYLIPQRIVMWTAGVSFFAKTGNKKEVIKTIITHPCILACLAGCVRMMFQIPFPDAVNTTLSSMGKCCTPLIMIFLGMIMQEVGFKKMITKDNILFTILRLFIIPACVLAVCVLFHLDPLISGISVLLAAMPAGSTTAILAEQYHANVEFAANCVVFTTIVSIAVLPVWVLFLNTVL